MANPLPDVNLLPKQESDPSNQFRIFIGMIAVLVLAYGVVGFYYASTKMKLADEQGTVAELRADKELLQIELAQLESAEANVMDIVSFIDRYDVTTSPLLADMAMLTIPSNSMLTSYVYENYHVDLTIVADTLTDVAAYTTLLNESDYAQDVKVNGVDAASDEDEAPDYTTTFSVDIYPAMLKGAREANE